MPFMFQFHKGSIKTQSGIPLIPIDASFNSIKVRLRLAGNEQSHRAASFNSIKVRLRHICFIRNINNVNCFNSIKVRLRHLDDMIKLPCVKFQFHKGSIKTESVHTLAVVYDDVSIP